MRIGKDAKNGLFELNEDHTSNEEDCSIEQGIESESKEVDKTSFAERFKATDAFKNAQKAIIEEMGLRHRSNGSGRQK